MPELIKPRPWAFNAGLTAPEWQWFWGPTNLGCGVLWEGSGSPLDFQTGVFGDINSNITWEGGQRGPELRLDGSASTSTHINLNNPDFANLTLPYTIIVYGNFYGSGNVILQTSEIGESDLTGDYYGALLEYSGSGSIWSIFGDGGFAASQNRRSFGFSSTNFKLGVPVVVGLTILTATTGYCWGGGIKDDTPSLDGTGGNLVNNSSGGRIGSQRLASDYSLYSWAVFNEDIGDGQHKMLQFDPFGPFRMADDVPEIVGGAAAGRIMSSLAASGGLAGMGGIAGQGGGLAG